jgi:hypothetical protein
MHKQLTTTATATAKQVTIVGGTRSLGHVAMIMPDRKSCSRQQLINRIFVYLAGRAAEEVGPILRLMTSREQELNSGFSVPETLMALQVKLYCQSPS